MFLSGAQVGHGPQQGGACGTRSQEVFAHLSSVLRPVGSSCAFKQRSSAPLSTTFPAILVEGISCVSTWGMTNNTTTELTFQVEGIMLFSNTLAVRHKAALGRALEEKSTQWKMAKLGRQACGLKLAADGSGVVATGNLGTKRLLGAVELVQSFLHQRDACCDLVGVLVAKGNDERESYLCIAREGEAWIESGETPSVSPTIPKLDPIEWPTTKNRIVQMDPASICVLEFKTRLARHALETRKEAGLKQTEMAEQLGMSVSKVSRIERVSPELSLDTYISAIIDMGGSMDLVLRGR